MSDAGTRYIGLKFMFGGMVVSGLGIYQAATGGLVAGNFYRILYPAIALPVGLLMLVFGALAFWMDDPKDAKVEETKNEADAYNAYLRQQGVLPEETAQPTTPSRLFLDPRILAVLMLLGVAAVKVAPVFIEFEKEEWRKQPARERASRESIARFNDQLAQKRVAFDRLEEKMTAAGFTQDEQEQVFRDFVNSESEGAKTSDSLSEVLEIDWKLLRHWDFEKLNPKVEELIQQRQVQREQDSAEKSKLNTTLPGDQ